MSKKKLPFVRPTLTKSRSRAQIHLSSQEKVFLQFINVHLKEYGRGIKNLTDLHTGIELFFLLKILINKNGKEFPIFGSMETTRINLEIVKKTNVNKILEYLQKEGVKLHGINSSAIVKEDKKMIMALIWAIIKFFLIDIGSKKKGVAAYSALVDWVNQRIGKKELEVTKMEDWKRGEILYGLIKKIFANKLNEGDEEIVKFIKDNETNEDNKLLIKNCIDFATSGMKIPRFLSEDEFLNPEKFSISTYLSYFRNFDKKEQKKYENKHKFVSELKNKILQLEKQLEMTKNELNDLKTKEGVSIKEMKDKMNDLNDLLNRRKKMVKEMKEKMKERDSIIRELKNKERENEKRFNEMERKLKRNNEDGRDVRSALDDCVKNRSKDAKKMQELSDKFEENLKQKLLLQRKAEENTSIIKELEDEKNGLNEKYSNLLQQKDDKYEKDMLKKDFKLKEIETKLLEFQKQMEDIRRKEKECQKERKRLGLELEHLREQLREKTKKCLELKKKVEEVEEKCEKFEDEKGILKRDLDYEKSNREKLERELEETKSTWKEKYSNKKKELNEEIDEWKRKMRENSNRMNEERAEYEKENEKYIRDMEIKWNNRFSEFQIELDSKKFIEENKRDEEINRKKEIEEEREKVRQREIQELRNLLGQYKDKLQEKKDEIHKNKLDNEKEIRKRENEHREKLKKLEKQMRENELNMEDKLKDLERKNKQDVEFRMKELNNSLKTKYKNKKDDLSNKIFALETEMLKVAEKKEKETESFKEEYSKSLKNMEKMWKKRKTSINQEWKRKFEESMKEAKNMNLNDKSKLKSKIQELEDRVKECLNKIDELKSTLKETNETIGKKDELIEEMEKRNDELDELLEKREGDLSRLRKQLDEMVNESKEKVTELENDFNEREKKFKNKIQNKEIEMKKKLEEKDEELIQKQNALRSELKNWKEKTFIEHENEINKLRNEFQSIIDEKDKRLQNHLSNKTNDLTFAIEDYKRKLESLKSKHTLEKEDMQKRFDFTLETFKKESEIKAKLGDVWKHKFTDLSNKFSTESSEQRTIHKEMMEKLKKEKSEKIEELLKQLENEKEKRKRSSIMEDEWQRKFQNLNNEWELKELEDKELHRIEMKEKEDLLVFLKKENERMKEKYKQNSLNNQCILEEKINKLRTLEEDSEQRERDLLNQIRDLEMKNKTQSIEIMKKQEEILILKEDSKMNEKLEEERKKNLKTFRDALREKEDELTLQKRKFNDREIQWNIDREKERNKNRKVTKNVYTQTEMNFELFIAKKKREIDLLQRQLNDTIQNNNKNEIDLKKMETELTQRSGKIKELRDIINIIQKEKDENSKEEEFELLRLKEDLDTSRESIRFLKGENKKNLIRINDLSESESQLKLSLKKLSRSSVNSQSHSSKELNLMNKTMDKLYKEISLKDDQINVKKNELNDLEKIISNFGVNFNNELIFLMESNMTNYIKRIHDSSKRLDAISKKVSLLKNFHKNNNNKPQLFPKNKRKKKKKYMEKYTPITKRSRTKTPSVKKSKSRRLNEEEEKLSPTKRPSTTFTRKRIVHYKTPKKKHKKNGGNKSKSVTINRSMKIRSESTPRKKLHELFDAFGSIGNDNNSANHISRDNFLSQKHMKVTLKKSFGERGMKLNSSFEVKDSSLTDPFRSHKGDGNVVNLQERFNEVKMNVNRLTNRQINEINSYTKPPPLMSDICKAILLLLGKSESDLKSWGKMRKFLKGKFLKDCKNYYPKRNKNFISIKEIIEKIDRKKVKRTSKVASLLFEFLDSSVQIIDNQNVEEYVTDSDEELGY